MPQTIKKSVVVIAADPTPNIALYGKAKLRYPAIEIAYLAVHEDYRGNDIGSVILQEIADLATRQNMLGCQFITVEAFCTEDYSAVGFYSKCGFSPTEMKKAYKDTVRMFYTLYPMQDD